MRRLTIVLVLGLLCWPLWASAQMTWTTQFTDVIRASGITATDADPVTYSLALMQQAGTLYRMQGPAVAQAGVTLPVNYEFGAYFDNRTDFFGGNPNCRARITLNPATLNGTNVMTCTGGSGAPFSVTVNMTRQLVSSVAYAIAMEREQTGASAAGDPQNNESLQP